MNKFKLQAMKESMAKAVFTFTALVSILAVALICVFLFMNGIPGMAKIGAWDFISGEKWKPGQEVFGILPFILGSIYVTAGALVVGVPAGLLTALFLSRFASKRMAKLLRPAVQLLAGIPSVVYGFFGLVVLVPLVRDVFGGTGSSLLTASVLLGMMILPTIITVAESALNAVPSTYYEGALALGATHERSVFHVVLPAAKSGVMAGVILHDMEKMNEIMANELGIASGYSFEGKMLGHLVLGVRELDRICEEMGIDNEKKVMLEHMIISHHYEPEFGSPKKPLFPEAEMLHYLDMIDAKMFDMEEAYNKTEPGEFSDRVWTLDNRTIYHRKG